MINNSGNSIKISKIGEEHSRIKKMLLEDFGVVVNSIGNDTINNTTDNTTDNTTNETTDSTTDGTTNEETDNTTDGTTDENQENVNMESYQAKIDELKAKWDEALDDESKEIQETLKN